MKIGNTSINVDALGSITKQEFIDMNRGTILNIEKEAEKLNKHFKQEFKSIFEPQQQKTKRRRK